MSYITEPLDAKHNKAEFSSGKDLLDNYFWKQAKQDVNRKLSTCFVMADAETNLVSGYYTLSSNSISNEIIPESFQQRLPKSYLSIPTILLGRLAVDKRHQEKGIGKLLLIDSLKRSFEISDSIGIFAVVADPIDADSERFYEKYGFIKLPDSGKMFLPMKTIKAIFQ